MKNSELPSENTIRVLLIEDNEDDVVLLREMLRKWRKPFIALEWHSDLEKGLEAAIRKTFDALLVDYRLGTGNAFDVLEGLKRKGLNTPCILLTGDDREGLDIDALQRGAADFLAKGELAPSLLVRSIRYAIERRRSDDALAESENRFRTMANAVPVLIWMSDAAGQCSFVNDSWLEFRGSTFEEELGEGWLAGVHPEDVDRLTRSCGEAKRSRSDLVVEFRMLRNDREYRWMLDTGKPLYMPDGTFSGFIGTCLDITDRKIAEKHLAAARDDALDNARLKSQFLANMSHEIRTPMNGILGMTGLLLQTELNQDQKDLTESVRSSGHSLLRIIDDILDFSRMEAGRLDMEETSFDLLSTLEDVVDLLAETARGKGVELICLNDPLLPRTLIGDPGRVRQIVLNLAGNAVKFTEKGEVIISVNLVHETQGEATIRLEIKDSGVGIPPEIHSKLFNAFVQGDGSTRRMYGGTGLGLAISKELVSLMNGEIGFDSQPGRGSRFWFTVPFQKDTSHPHQIDPAFRRWRGRKVLVTHPNPEVRSTLCRHLSHYEIDCFELVQPSKALDLMEEEARQKNPFDLILLGTESEGEKTVDLLARFHRSPLKGSTRVVPMTFLFNAETVKAYREAGADELLGQPILQSQLTKLLERIWPLVEKPISKPAAPKALPHVQLHFLIVGDDSTTESIQKTSQSIGSTADTMNDPNRAIQALSIFRYDAVFINATVGEKAIAALHRTIDGQPSPPPTIALGDADSSPHPAFDARIEQNPDPANLIRVLSQCGLLELVYDEPTPPRMTIEEETPPPPAPNRKDPLNLDRIREILRLEEEGEDVLQDLLDMFRQELPHRVTRIKEAIDKNDLEAVRFLAHSIKGITSNLGATHMVELCRGTEHAAMAGNGVEARDLAELLDAERLRVENALQNARVSLRARQTET